MNSREVVVWLDERWYDALSRQLKKKDTTVEDELNEYLDAMIDQLPEQMREKISREIWEEDQRQRGSAEANRRISVFRVTQGGRTDHLLTQSAVCVDALHAAAALRTYLLAKGNSTQRFAERLHSVEHIVVTHHKSPSKYSECKNYTAFFPKSKGGKQMPYIHFTEEQKLRANAADLVEFLRFKGEPLIREGSEYRLSSNHSVTVRGNEWYDHATEKGGGPVTFLKEFYGMNYQEAVLTLLNEDVGQLSPQVSAPREKVKKPFELPPANDTNRRVFAYLLKHRHLDRDVLTAFVRAGLIYEDQKYHNAVFVGRDNDGTARHAHKRSTNSQGKTFRMTAEGSDFRYAFNWPGTSGHLLVFEAPIDMLSLISLYHDSDWAKHSYVALCGTSSQPLLGMLERHPNIENVLLCLDNDQAGQLATRRLAAVVRERGLTVDARVPACKDWNDDLCANFQQTEEQQFEQKARSGCIYLFRLVSSGSEAPLRASVPGSVHSSAFTPMLLFLRAGSTLGSSAAR